VGDLPRIPNSNDIKQAAIQKLRSVDIIAEERWWSDMEFLTHQLKFCKIEHTTITVTALPNEPL